MAMPEDFVPLIVQKNDFRYECFSLSSEPTQLDITLMALLKKIGGVNENTENGMYNFYVEMLDEDNFVLHLDPRE